MSEVFLQARDVRKSYTIDKTSLEVLKGVTVDVQKGEILAIVGPSGAGKSTLLHVLGGLDQPTSGEVMFQGQSVYRQSTARLTQMRAARIGFVFQAYHLLPELDIVDNVLLPALSMPGALRRMASHRSRALALLERVGLGQRARHMPMELSGGEQQRVALARALMNDPDVLLADEPTGNLDSKTGQQVLDYLFDLTRDRGHTLVLVSHNEAVADLCHRKVMLRDGCLAS